MYILPPCFHLLQFYNVLLRPEAIGYEYHILFSCRWKYNLSFKTHSRQKNLTAIELGDFPTFQLIIVQQHDAFSHLVSWRKWTTQVFQLWWKITGAHTPTSENPYQEKRVKNPNSKKSSSQQAERDMSTTDIWWFEFT